MSFWNGSPAISAIARLQARQNRQAKKIWQTTFEGQASHLGQHLIVVAMVVPVFFLMG